MILTNYQHLMKMLDYIKIEHNMSFVNMVKFPKEDGISPNNSLYGTWSTEIIVWCISRLKISCIP